MNSKSVNAVRISVLAGAIVFIAIGVLRGEALEVLKKATDICLSCMGIG